MKRALFLLIFILQLIYFLLYSTDTTHEVLLVNGYWFQAAVIRSKSIVFIINNVCAGHVTFKTFQVVNNNINT